MSKDERIDLLDDAKELINQAIDNIYIAFEGTGERSRLEAYICGHVSGWANWNNPHDDTGIPTLM